MTDIFIIANVDETRFRTWEDCGFGWTDDRNKSLWFARRSDAERVAAEDEDAWKILTFEESGWLIERADSEPSEPKYWCGGGYWDGVADPRRPSAWTSNHLAAIRFARKDDAVNVAERTMSGIEVRIREHGWG